MEIINTSNNPHGGRKATAYLRLMNEIASDFNGLPNGISPYECLRLLKAVGRKRGFTSTLINHLEYLINHTQSRDWISGQPIIFKSISKMAVDLGISERQVTERENSLHKLGVLTWRDSGNHKRYGHRNAQGDIVDAYGVNLAPIAALVPCLQEEYEDQISLAKEWASLKRQVSYYRRQVKQSFLELSENNKLDEDTFISFVNSSSAMLKRIRAGTPLSSLQSLLDDLKDALSKMKTILIEISTPVSGLLTVNKSSWMQKTSAKAEVLRRHKYNTINNNLSKDKVMAHDVSNKQTPEQMKLSKLFCSSKRRSSRTGQSLSSLVGQSNYDRSKKVDPNTTGFQHIKIGNLLHAMSPVFKAYLNSRCSSASWAGIIDAAYDVTGELGIKNSLWSDACVILGRDVAAVVVLIIDVNINHPTNPIKSPAAVLHKMIANAQAGKLALHQSLFGILARKSEGVS